MTYFTKGIDKYLANWIVKDTCLTPQDIEDNFYPFVVAVYRNSRRIKDRTRSLEDPDIADLPIEQRKRIVNARICRNPRTSEMSSFREKVSRAIKTNHPEWNGQYIEDEVEKLSEIAIIILDAFWSDSRFSVRGLDDIPQHIE
jgi:hypothetical protein